MIDRRALLSLAAAAPFAGGFHRLDLPDLRVDPLELEDGNGVRLLSISPDGSVLVGIRGDDTLCFFDADSKSLLSESAATPEVAVMDERSIRWSPDSTRLAFDLHLRTRREESDIFVADVESAALTNITHNMVIDDSNRPANVDPTPRMAMYPIWLDDSTIVFASWRWNEEERMVNQLVTLEPGATEPSLWADLESAGLEILTSTLWPTSDGQVMFTSTTGLFTAGEGETPQLIDIGEVGVLDLMDASDTHVVLRDARNFTEWHVPLDDPDSRRETRDIFGLENDEHLASFSSIGPTSDSLIATVADANNTVRIYQDDRVREIAYLPGDDIRIDVCMWRNHRALVASETTSWLLSHKFLGE